VFACFGFHVQAFLYVFTGGAGRFWFATAAPLRFALSPGNAGIMVARIVALVIYVFSRRSRYFGNTAPLLMALGLGTLYTTQVTSAPWVWALPFLFTFVGGVFADALDHPTEQKGSAGTPTNSKQRKMFLGLTVAIVVTQAALCWLSLAGIVRG
jgi:hypothetical protein